jgi:hypothetical protein
MEKKTNKQYAVKIIDISGEKSNDNNVSVEQIKADTLREVNVLRMCSGHPNISQWSFVCVCVRACV